MRDASTIVRERQRDIRCEMDDREISLKAAASKADMSLSTFTSYFHGERDRVPAALSVPSLFKLIKGEALPLELLSMLLPNGYHIVRAPGELDHDVVCKLACDYVSTKVAAHHPESEAGVDIGPGEDEQLTAIVVELKAAA